MPSGKHAVHVNGSGMDLAALEREAASWSTFLGASAIVTNTGNRNDCEEYSRLAVVQYYADSPQDWDVQVDFWFSSLTDSLLYKLVIFDAAG